MPWDWVQTETECQKTECQRNPVPDDSDCQKDWVPKRLSANKHWVSKILSAKKDRMTKRLSDEKTAWRKYWVTKMLIDKNTEWRKDWVAKRLNDEKTKRLSAKKDWVPIKTDTASNKHHAFGIWPLALGLSAVWKSPKKNRERRKMFAIQLDIGVVAFVHETLGPN